MTTEEVSPRFEALDRWPAAEIAAAVAEGQLGAAAVVRAASDRLAAAADAVAERLRCGEGRLVYAGAGASGRLAVQDGVELWPTFGWPPERLVHLMAGGEAALVRSVEGAEDDGAGAAARVEALGLGPGDAVLAVAASGRTPWAVEAARAARGRGALVVGLACVAGSPLLGACDHPIALVTGPEVVAGSTRMAAGTAQKAALNVLSTAVMVRLGRVHGNLMVELASSNLKLDGRRVAILRRIVAAGEDEARDALARSGGSIRLAALMLRGHDEAGARAGLEAAGGDLRAALGAAPRPEGARDDAGPRGAGRDERPREGRLTGGRSP